MDDEYRRVGGMVILDLQRESFAMKWLEMRSTGVIDEHKSVCLFLMNTWGQSKDESYLHQGRTE
jgi:hypothetical protein